MRRAKFVAILTVLATGAAWSDSMASGAGIVARDVARAAGIYAEQLSWSVSTVDVNRDGWTDLMVVPHSDGPAHLYRNDRGRFVEIHAGVFSRRDRHDCRWADVNGDGRPDAYCTIGADAGEGAAANELWIQQPGGRFIDLAGAYGVADAQGRGRHVAFIDVNHDPYPDLYVGNDYPRADGLPATNRLFINVGGRAFRSAPEYGLDRTLGANSIQVVDFDSDGWEDLLVSGNTSVRLYRNRRGRSFADVSRPVGIDYGGESAMLVDVDGDGFRDFVLVRYKDLLVKYGGPWGYLTPRTKKLPLQAGVRMASGDVNRDGVADLYIVQAGAAPDLVLLGPGLTSVPIPQAAFGSGHAVGAIDHDRNGHTDFVVLNGGAGRGPVQLVAFFPS